MVHLHFSRVAVAVMVVLGSASLLQGCGGGATPVERPGSPSNLPEPRSSGGIALNEALSLRRSDREFGEGALDSYEVSDLLWAAQGITEPEKGYRTAPSAGALYPLTVYLLRDGTVEKYVPESHSLVPQVEGVNPGELVEAASGQAFIGDSPAVFVVSCDLVRSEKKYGSRAFRYACIEAGHAAQNLVLEATALGLASVTVGAFDDSRVRTLLGLPSGETPLYLIPVGRRD